MGANTLRIGLISSVLAIANLLPYSIFAQSQKLVHADTLEIQEIVITDLFFPEWYDFSGLNDTVGLSRNELDAGILLNKYAPMYIRGYGRGLSYSLSVRGSNSAHVKVLWNGIPLNNPMQGQVDFSLININHSSKMLFDPNTYAYGLSGTLAISDKSPDKEGMQIRISEKLSSTLGHFLNSDLNYQKGKLSAAVSFSMLNDKNRFTYDFQDESRQISNNSLNQYQAKASLRYKRNAKQAITLHFWGIESKRQIPPSLYENSSDAKQDDTSFRLASQFQHLGNKTAINFSLAAVIDNLAYTSVQKNIYSYSEANRYIQQFDINSQISSSVSILMKFDHEMVNVRSNQYTFNPSYNDLFLFLQSKLILSNKQDLKIGLKGATRSFNKMDFAPYLYYRNSLTEDFRILIAAGRKFRYPSTNDLFWAQGGNSGLETESAWEAEIAFNFLWGEHLTLENRSYYKQVKNWIQWLPLEGIFTAQNLDLVASKGMENSLHFKLEKKNFRLKSTILHQLNYSRYAYGVNKGRLLIYKPIHILKNNNVVIWKKWNVELSQQFNGSVYTTSDHSNSLDPYYLLSLQVAHSYKFTKGKIDIHAGVINLLNRSYFTVENYLMPGRIYEFGLAYKYN